MKRIYQGNDNYNEQTAFINRQCKKNKQAVLTVFLEIFFVFHLNVSLHRSPQQTKKNTPIELHQYEIILRFIFRGKYIIIYISCLDAGCSA